MGFYPYPGFQNVSGSEYSGYVYDYLYELRKYTHWDYEFVPLTFSQCLDALSRGEIDLLCGIYKTENRTQQFLFPDSSCGIDTLGVYVREDDERFAYDDVESLQGIRIGLLRGSEEEVYFHTFCQEHALTVTTAFYDDDQALCSALTNGEVDALISSNIHQIENVRPVANFAFHSFYFVTNKMRKDVLVELNDGLNHLHYNNPDFEKGLRDKYFSATVSSKPIFTRAETAYLNTHPVIRVAYCTKWNPLAYQKEDGSFGGIIASVFNKIEEYTNIRFEYYGYESYPELVHAFETGKVDMLSHMSSDYSWSSKHNAILSRTYLKMPTITIRTPHAADTANATLALQEGTHLTQKIAQQYPNAKIKLYPNIADCIEALAEGDAEITFANSYVTREYLSDSRYKTLDAITLADDVRALSLAYPTDGNTTLISIIDKTLGSISQSELTEMILKETLVDDSFSLTDFIYQHPIETVSAITAILALIILMLSISMIIKSKHNREIWALTYTDLLTDTPNFNQFRKDAVSLLSVPHAHPYALVYFNINHFKNINDTLGYAVGDRILKVIANVLSDNMRPGELCARVHSDHFAALAIFEGEEPLATRIFAMEQLFRDALRNICNINLTYSVGIYCLTKQDHDFNKALDRAKYAEDNASNAPHCSMMFYNKEMRLRLLHDQALENELPQALDRDEFFLLYQPKVDCYTGKTIGLEALVRWDHPTRGILSPGEFIPQAEKIGFVTKIDFYVFESTCKMLRAQIDAGRDPLPVSCNFSRLHLSNSRFVTQISAIADRYNVAHDLLEIEITETVALANLEVMVPQFEEMKRCGFSIAIDDFGSGYSSLSLLTALPCDTIKLDKSFLKHKPITEDDKMLLGCVISLAHKMGKCIICEGVETAEHIALMHELQCNIVQGYYYSRPLTLEELKNHLTKEANLSPVP